MNAAEAKSLLGDNGRPTVLVVEDEVLVRLLIADELRFANFVVVEAISADEALSVLRSSPHIDVLLTDVRMPGSMDGIELAKMVAETWPEIKIVLTSGHYTPSSGLSLGYEFIAKPYDPIKLVERIEQLLAEDK